MLRKFLVNVARRERFRTLGRGPIRALAGA
jgi:hypothetical protein